MTQEHKELLFKDLCARLPYEVKLQFSYVITSPAILKGIDKDFIECDIVVCELKDIKPYLFPLSSMTEEQKKEYEGIIYKNIELHCERYYDVIDIDDFNCLMDFYHKYHFDYRGLIRLELAIDATNLNIY